ncbi:MAG: thioesterase family protein [Chloroflexota bacterium]
MSRRSEPPSGEFRYEHPIEVRFVDTDAFGHVNNATFLSYFEAARAGYYAHVTGSPFMTGEHGLKHTFVIAEARIAYRSPVLFGEPLLAGVRFAWVGGSSFGLEYRIRAAKSVVGEARSVADGETLQVMFDLDRNRVIRVPADLIGLFEKFEEGTIPRRPAAEG